MVSTGGSALRAAATRMARAAAFRAGEAAQVALLMAQIGRLSVSIARLREVPLPNYWRRLR